MPAYRPRQQNGNCLGIASNCTVLGAAKGMAFLRAVVADHGQKDLDGNPVHPTCARIRRRGDVETLERATRELHRVFDALNARGCLGGSVRGTFAFGLRLSARRFLPCLH